MNRSPPGGRGGVLALEGATRARVREGGLREYTLVRKDKSQWGREFKVRRKREKNKAGVFSRGQIIMALTSPVHELFFLPKAG